MLSVRIKLVCTALSRSRSNLHDNGTCRPQIHQQTDTTILSLLLPHRLTDLATYLHILHVILICQSKDDSLSHQELDSRSASLITITASLSYLPIDLKAPSKAFTPATTPSTIHTLLPLSDPSVSIQLSRTISSMPLIPAQPKQMAPTSPRPSCWC